MALILHTDIALKLRFPAARVLRYNAVVSLDGQLVTSQTGNRCSSIVGPT